MNDKSTGRSGVLVLSDPSWDRAIRLAIGDMYGIKVQRAGSVPSALARLAATAAPITHMLVQEGWVGAALDQLHAARASAGLQLITLGRTEQGLSHVNIPYANGPWLSKMLASIEPEFSSMAETVLPEADVPDALTYARLMMRYQPMVAIADRAPFALEVLARLDHPDLGTLRPNQFVPQLEHAGMASELTDAVVDAAFQDHQTQLHNLGMALSLNFPLEVLIQPEQAQWLEQRRLAAGVPASCLLIELTESQPVALLDRPAREALRQSMLAMRDLGYRLAIDDFGPEMPDRMELFSLPFNLLKLDKAVVTDPARANLITQAVEASHRNGMKVIAEGVEDQLTWDRMAELGVDYVQGFLVSRPLPARSVKEWIAQWLGEEPPK